MTVVAGDDVLLTLGNDVATVQPVRRRVCVRVCVCVLQHVCVRVV
jgi:hypothetical protein